MIEIRIERRVLIEPGAVAAIAEQFAEWLDAEGFALTHSADERGYQELAEAFEVALDEA